jgi:hypothetical protein
MKQWFSNRLLSIKHGGAYTRAFFDPVVGLLFILLFAQWLMTPYVHIGHLLFTVIVVCLIDGRSFSQGVACEREWTIKHPRR